MIVFPNAKINLGLQVLAKRPDGFHNLSTIFYPVPLCDVLEAVILDDKENQELHDFPVEEYTLNNGKKVFFSLSGLQISGSPENNLCLKACKIFNDQSEITGNIAVHLHKVIPMGAGLGGGSSDGAFMLKLLNRLSANPLTEFQLLELAAQLGSDCAFFIKNTPCIASGRGEILEPLEFSLSGKFIVIVYPEIHVNTATAFSGIELNQQQVDLRKIISDPASWPTEMKNDFEKNIFARFPEIEKIKASLLDFGALYASMSGSGSAVFGIFENEQALDGLWMDYRKFQYRLS